MKNKRSASVVVAGLVIAGAGVTASPALAAEAPVSPVTANLLSGKDQAPKPVQALEVFSTNNEALLIAFREPTTGPAIYKVAVNNVTTGKDVWATETKEAPTPESPIKAPFPEKGNYVVRVTAVNDIGSSTMSRAMIDGKIAPINMLNTVWSQVKGEDSLTLVWNAPNYSPFGMIPAYYIYNANGDMVDKVEGEKVTYNAEQIAKLGGKVAIEPVAENGKVGPRVTKAIEKPTPGYAVALTAPPTKAVVGQEVKITGTQKGYAPGAKVIVWVQVPGKDWVEFSASELTGSDFSGVARFDNIGSMNLRVSVTDGSRETFSPVSVVTVTK